MFSLLPGVRKYNILRGNVCVCSNCKATRDEFHLLGWDYQIEQKGIEFYLTTWKLPDSAYFFSYKLTIKTTVEAAINKLIKQAKRDVYNHEKTQ